MKDIIALIKSTIEKRNLIIDLAKSDFKRRFVGSYFGVAWMFVQPMVTVLIYFLVFQMGFKSTPPIPDTPYVLWLIPAIVPWFYFSEILTTGTNCLKEYDYLVKKVVFNVEILPVIKLVSSAIVHVIFILIMIAMFLLQGRLPMLSWLQIAYYSFALSMYALAIVYICTAVNVFFKDMAQIVSIALQFGMWATPIMWSPDIFPQAPAWIDKVLKVNPLYYIVVGYRDSMLQGNAFWQRPMLGLYFWAVTLSLFWLSIRIFNKLKVHFSDVL